MSDGSCSPNSARSLRGRVSDPSDDSFARKSQEAIVVEGGPPAGDKFSAGVSAVEQIAEDLCRGSACHSAMASSST
jgi:hypothetical protein